MLRAVVSKRVIDRLLREKLRQAVTCSGISAMPVVWRRRLGVECNWEIPGWTGDVYALAACTVEIGEFVRSLEAQFDIADEAGEA